MDSPGCFTCEMECQLLKGHSEDHVTKQGRGDRGQWGRCLWVTCMLVTQATRGVKHGPVYRPLPLEQLAWPTGETLIMAGIAVYLRLTMCCLGPLGLPGTTGQQPRPLPCHIPPASACGKTTSLSHCPVSLQLPRAPAGGSSNFRLQEELPPAAAPPLSPPVPGCDSQLLGARL